ncbi:hypothetical protein NP233_g12312 [Leucocoprinus birnbaumii]|uniref:Protein kinase domain-containing protein n=1 Tax=Leucocoprinus birnbaumii TaxID=56174 RepID=A0AAD5YKJ0_9AGAR|nr:hypothetical protein NP233_g12312 [Leucocoprinus birnbaumii]
MDVDTVVSSSTAEEETEVEHSGSENEEDEAEENEEEGEDESSSDDHLLHFATPKQLARLRKPDLVRLYTIAGLPDDAELLTKHEIIDCLISAREDYASLPPSSPIRGDGSSSGSLSDDGNVAGGEETDAATVHHPGPNGAMRRRVTLQDFGSVNGRPPKGRSMSMGNLMTRDDGHAHTRKNSVEVRGESSGSSGSRRRTSAQSSPNSSTPASTSTRQSPPATRLRSRKVSTTTSIPSTTPTSADSKSGRGKSKSKQVEFNEQVDVKLQTPSKRRLRDRKQEREKSREARAGLLEDESDLTDVDEVGLSLHRTANGDSRPQPSPRRLRSKDKESDRGKGKTSDADTPRAERQLTRSSKPSRGRQKKVTRIPPLTKGVHRGRKGRMQKEEEGDEEQLGGEEEVEEAASEEIGDEEEGEEEEEEEGGGRGRGRGKRLRPRTRNGSTTPDDGDVEDEGEEDDAESEVVEDEELEAVEETQESGEENDEAEEEVEEEAEEDAEEDAEAVGGDEDSMNVAERRKLRSGKLVGDEDVEMETAEEDIGEEDSETGEEEEEEEEAEVDAGSEIDMDAEGETDEDEVMEEEVDLTIATAKTLIRLRRDDLVRLCETRDLEPVGTKPQLAEALLEWRDRQANDRSSPSSTGTVRPPSTTTRRRRRKATTSSVVTATPVLLRSEHLHQDEPRTPVPEQDKEADHELELDLESLGLEDREIPPEKLTKLEKIGSGGFKDVFIGKFKGRRVAISEFRGTLSAMDIKELKLLGGFDHPNIVRFLGVSIPENTKETPVMIVSELCSNGDLFDYIRNTNTPSLHKVLSMMLDIARGLEYLHMRKPSVIHRDCKSSNILITARGTAKIADFGLAKVKQSTRSMVKSLVGTVNWQAPELWTAHPKYNHKVDVFSCALVFWEMLQWHLPVRKHPWEGMNEHAIYDVVGAKRQRPSVSGLRKQWCSEIVDLMERMWAQEHQDRPTMTEVVLELEKMLAHR